MTYTRSKKQYAALSARAAALVAAGVGYRAARDILVAEFRCDKSTAHRAYRRAEAGGGDNWGGRREGAGRPALQTTDKAI